jgi:Excreted virulence factor EspC, type VII ESX diderm
VIYGGGDMGVGVPGGGVPGRGEDLPVDTAQLRSHAQRIAAVQARFDAARTAGAYIAGNHAAYGLLSGWTSAVLAGRHARQDELIADVEENLSLIADGLRGTADRYDGARGRPRGR